MDDERGMHKKCAVPLVLYTTLETIQQSVHPCTQCSSQQQIICTPELRNSENQQQRSTYVVDE